MQGDPKIIHHLQAQLRNELTATNQYFLHYRILQHWGFGKLAKKEYEESIGEMKHADKLMARILMLDGLPNLQDLGKLLIGEDVPEILDCDLRLERGAQATIKEGMAACEAARDYVSRDLLQDILALTDIASPNAPLAALVAHDWGGALAWAFANQHPGRMARLVIVNAPHPATLLRELRHNPAQQAASAYMNFLVRPDAARLLTENGHARLFGFFEGMGASATPGSPGAPLGAGWLTESVRAQYRAVWDLGVQGGLNYYCASPLHPAHDQNAPPLELTHEATRVDVPTLVLWAQDDTALLPCLCEGLETWVPRLKQVPLHQATHWVVHEQPQRVIAEISAFLRDQ